MSLNIKNSVGLQQDMVLFDDRTIERLKDLSIENELTLSVAESVTAGYLQAALSSAKDALQYFQGGITTYNIGQKARHLQVDPVGALAANCVSEKVSIQMALNVSTLFSSDVGIAITGYSAPMPEKKIENLYAWFAVSKGGQILISQKITPLTDGEGIPVQLDYTGQVLQHTLKVLEKHLAKR